MHAHLDTNFLVYYTNGNDQVLIDQMDSWLLQGWQFSISAMVWAEFLSGPLTPTEHALAQTMLSGILPVTRDDAALAAELFQSTGRRSRSLPDCVIAATAIRSSVPLATKNHSDFKAFVPYGLNLL
jgi:predicted nucleic acid-binding protein